MNKLNNSHSGMEWLILLTNPILSQTGWMKYNKNKENQRIDFRLLTTTKKTFFPSLSTI
ncbi:hypothetical protein J0B02_04435 [Enterobacteriaceae bacterium YMB-R22]|uniref:hypothetical protein n=1 Tax=Tenebrionicola larvae TaxID=2815733 RepID=UPI002013AC65|nr:hypothetical protein [Tenebrionicola larvae]MBV4412084.1 hypothetical protein [Tenebrionicola larvae]